MNVEITMPTSEVIAETLTGLSRRKDLYGLPCKNCRAYYESYLAVCPICQCNQRISPRVTFARVATAF